MPEHIGQRGKFVYCLARIWSKTLIWSISVFSILFLFRCSLLTIHFTLEFDVSAFGSMPFWPFSFSLRFFFLCLCQPSSFLCCCGDTHCILNCMHLNVVDFFFFRLTRLILLRQFWLKHNYLHLSCNDLVFPIFVWKTTEINCGSWKPLKSGLFKNFTCK